MFIICSAMGNQKANSNVRAHLKVRESSPGIKNSYRKKEEKTVMEFWRTDPLEELEK